MAKSCPKTLTTSRILSKYAAHERLHDSDRVNVPNSGYILIGPHENCTTFTSIHPIALICITTAVMVAHVISKDPVIVPLLAGSSTVERLGYIEQLDLLARRGVDQN